MKNLKKYTWTLVLSILLLTLLASCGGNSQTITIASKTFTEQFILGEMYAQVLENAGYKVERKLNLGGTPVAHQAMLDGQIDIYPEYTGTGLLTVLKEGMMSDPQAVYDLVKQQYAEQFNFVWLNPAPMNNTQALAMLRTKAEEMGITNFSEMVAQADQLVLIGSPEFAEREDGIPGLKRVYGDFEFKDFLTVDAGLRYQAILNGEADIVVAYGTDGELAAYDLLVLNDDKGLYPLTKSPPSFANPSSTKILRLQTFSTNSLPSSPMRPCKPSTTKSVAMAKNQQMSPVNSSPNKASYLNKFYQ